MFLCKHFRNRNVCSKDNHCDDKGIWEDVRHQREIRHAQRGKTEIKKKKILLGYEYVMVASSRKRRYSPCLLVAQSLNFLGKKNVKGALNPLLTIFWTFYKLILDMLNKTFSLKMGATESFCELCRNGNLFRLNNDYNFFTNNPASVWCH